MKNSIVLLLLVAACVSSSSALRCYSCVFPGDPKCQEAKDLQPDDCSEPGATEKALGIKAICLKSVVDVQGVKQISRSCNKQGGTINACSLIKDHVEHCSVCDNDLCNSSTNLLISVWSVMMPVAIAFFMKFA